jgi:hypothetical protein
MRGATFCHSHVFSVPTHNPGQGLVVDNTQIPTGYRLVRFLKEEPMFSRSCTINNTAFFCRGAVTLFDPYDGGWWNQANNLNHLNELKPCSIRAKGFLKRCLPLT